jgi:hypothetical protein
VHEFAVDPYSGVVDEPPPEDEPPPPEEEDQPAEEPPTKHRERKGSRKRKASKPPPRPVYPTVHAWVAGWLVTMYPHDLLDHDRKLRWCPHWHEHPEAVARLDALWQAWEALRLVPGTGIASWWTTYADPIMGRLLDPDHGPFRRCTPTEHKTAPPLPVERPSEWLSENVD